jgi:hypothetical protein
MKVLGILILLLNIVNGFIHNMFLFPRNFLCKRPINQLRSSLSEENWDNGEVAWDFQSTNGTISVNSTESSEQESNKNCCCDFFRSCLLFF